MNVHFDFRGLGSSNRNASRGESVETGDGSVETRDESIEAREKHNNHVIIEEQHEFGVIYDGKQLRFYGHTDNPVSLIYVVRRFEKSV